MHYVIAIWLSGVLLGCVSHSAHLPAHAAGHGHAAATADDAAALGAIRGVHGGAGPWVVAGYRMGRYALARLGLDRGSFEVDVVHHSPAEVQYACVADGAAAATGASLGRLSLRLEPAVAAETRTTYLNKRTGASVTLEVTAEFGQRYVDVPRAQLSAAGAEVLHLSDAEIFRELPPQDANAQR